MTAARVFVAAFLFAGAALVAACGSLVMSPPGADPLAVLLTQNSAVRATCIDMLNRDRLTVNGGTRCLLVTNQTADAVALARAGQGGDVEAARLALIELENYLKGQEQ